MLHNRAQVYHKVYQLVLHHLVSYHQVMKWLRN
ncbi:unnamed protein product [Brugia pahangi]|uniref:Uncharacterized protein n=1 Tax=Brugia pahangi TaxID=6280 RepID=A0A0N4TGP2_BRUPA|nr:unnamed protein product [Brugia pahangi]